MQIKKKVLFVIIFVSYYRNNIKKKFIIPHNKAITIILNIKILLFLNTE